MSAEHWGQHPRDWASAVWPGCPSPTAHSTAVVAFSAVGAVLAGGDGAMAIEAAGETKARSALEQAVRPFTRPDGSVAMRNVFRYAIARRAEP